MPGQGIGAISITKVDGDSESSKNDIVALEEPLEIRLGYGSDEKVSKKHISNNENTWARFRARYGFFIFRGYHRSGF